MARRRTSVLKDRLIELKAQKELLSVIRAGFEFKNKDESQRFDELQKRKEIQFQEVERLLNLELNPPEAQELPFSDDQVSGDDKEDAL